jgi:hypothetical protein
MTESLDALNTAVSLLIKAALFPVRFSGRVRRRRLPRLAVARVRTSGAGRCNSRAYPSRFALAARPSRPTSLLLVPSFPLLPSTRLLLPSHPLPGIQS